MSNTPPPPLLPAGWYPDPVEPGQRYWDGNAWTDSHSDSHPAAPPAPQSGTAQEAKKTRWKWRWKPKWRWIGAAAILILAMWGAGTEKQGLTAERPPTSVSSPDTAGSPALDAAPTLDPAPQAQLNEEVRDGAFAFTVTDVEMTKTIGDGTSQRASQGTYVVVTMNVQNVGDTPHSFDGGIQTLLDTAGRQYAVDGGADYDLNKDIAAGLGADINPGDQISVKIVFDLPPGAHPSALELHDSKVSGGAIVRLP